MRTPTFGLSLGLFVLGFAAGPAVAQGGGPAAAVVERALTEMPAAIAPEAELVVVSERPGFVRWGVNGWTLPAPGLRPAGTVAVDSGAVETELTGPAVDGRYRARLGPFPQGVASLELALRHPDGWSEADVRTAVEPGVATRRRPITIGPGPFIGRSGGVSYHEELQDWELLDCRGVDAADDGRDLGDAFASSRDLIAFYSRREDDALYLRADLLDLAYGAEEHALDLVVLVDCAPGGQTWLPNFVRGRTTEGWNLAVMVPDGRRGHLLDASWSLRPGFRGAHFASDLDAVELGVSLDALRAAGWDGQRELGFWVYTVADGRPYVADAFGQAVGEDGVLHARVSESRRSGTAKYSVILHGNQAVQPMSWIRDLVESGAVATPAGNPTGYGRALDAHELFRAPVNIHVSGSLAASLEWAAPAFNERIRGFLDGRPETGSGALLGGVLAEHMMPYFENARSAHGREGANAASIRLKDEALDRIYGGPPRSVFWIPERVVRGSTFADVLADAQGQPTGYRFAVVDQTTHLRTWFGAADAHGPNGHKINRINGVSCFVINDDADQWKFANSDDGLWIWTRRELVRKALDPDQEQLTLVFDDWEAFAGRSFTSFGVGNDNPDNYERTLRWIANHPFVQVVTLEEVARWGWGEVERGHRPDLAIETYDWLRHATETSYDNWYYGSPQEESFADLHLLRAPGERIPWAYGAVDRPGTLLEDVWSRVARAPEGRLRDLGAAAFSVAMFETAWHDEDMNDYLPKTASGDYRFPDTTWDPIAGWARATHSRVGDAAILAAAARWSASPPAAATAWREDVDRDGREELLLADARAFYVIEPDGGRLVLAAVRDPATGEADVVVCSLLNAPGEEVHRDREATHDDRVTRSHGLVDWWADGGGSRYVNGTFAGEQVPGGWLLRSDDGRVEKRLTLADGRLTVAYALDPALGALYVRNGLAPAALDLFMGAPLEAAWRADGALVAWSAAAAPAAPRRVEVALVPLAGARLNRFADFGGRGPRGVPFAYQAELSGQGAFAFRLEPSLR